VTSSSLRLGEFAATLALAQDTAFGQPLESQPRSCLLATWICDAASLPVATRETVYWVSLLRYVGCTGHAHEVAALFGDDIAIRGQTLVHDAANLGEVVQDAIAYAAATRRPEEHEAVAALIHVIAGAWVTHNSQSGCEVADMLVQRLDLGPEVREALRFTFERWNGNGFPTHAKGDEIPIAMRVVHLSHDMEAIGRRFSPERAVAAARERRDRTYDPALADVFVERGLEWFGRLTRIEPWDAVLALEPEPRRLLDGDDLDRVLLVAADFVDVKSPFMGGHSRRCARLAAEACRVLGLPDGAIDDVRRAALVHEFGITSISNAILDKPGDLTRVEFDRVELHPLMTEQLLRRSRALAALSPVASAHHERCDGTGYHRRVCVDRADAGACVLAATEVYVGMTTERADRPAHAGGAAAAELRSLAERGCLEPRATRAVLVAAGEAQPEASSRRRGQHPGGLSQREVEVLGLAVLGLTKQQIADRLFIAPKTADHHIEHIYTKIGVSTRAAAALWAVEHEIVRVANGTRSGPTSTGKSGR
jgi:HD-GYP domain-containing protein (c-di-GMP phosphodiesterase class II)